MMARKVESKSLGEARIPPRALAARVPVAAAVPEPEPRHLDGGKRKEDPTAFGELLGQKVQGEKATSQPFNLLTFHAYDGSAQAPKQGRTRRRYEENERLGVANTRKRGACDACRVSKTKCLHGPSEIATEKYRVQPQSHELFALGLTTDSETANEDEHKQVMEEKIAALDDKLVKAQTKQSGENNEGNGDGDGGVKAATRVAPISPPERVVGPKGPTSQLQNHLVQVHHAPAQPDIPVPFQQGTCMRVFKLKGSGTGKPTRKGQANKGSSKAATDVASGRKRLDARGPSSIPQPIVCQQQSAENVFSPAALKQPYDKNLTTWPPTRQEDLRPCSATAKNNVRIGCKSFQEPFEVDLESPRPDYSRINSERLRPSEKSNTSERDTQTMATEDSMLSLDRSTTPFSERSASDPPSYVHLADLERSKSHDIVLTDHQIVLLPKPLAHRQTLPLVMELDEVDERPFLYEELLNADLDYNALTSMSKGTELTAYQSGSMSFDAITSEVAQLEPKWSDLADIMEIDT